MTISFTQAVGAILANKFTAKVGPNALMQVNRSDDAGADQNTATCQIAAVAMCSPATQPCEPLLLQSVGPGARQPHGGRLGRFQMSGPDGRCQDRATSDGRR
jgi:hypothetical protein